MGWCDLGSGMPFEIRPADEQEMSAKAMILSPWTAGAIAARRETIVLFGVQDL